MNDNSKLLSLFQNLRLQRHCLNWILIQGLNNKPNFTNFTTCIRQANISLKYIFTSGKSISPRNVASQTGCCTLTASKHLWSLWKHFKPSRVLVWFWVSWRAMPSMRNTQGLWRTRTHACSRNSPRAQHYWKKMLEAAALLGVGFCSSHMLSFLPCNHVSEHVFFTYIYLFCKIDDKWK